MITGDHAICRAILRAIENHQMEEADKLKHIREIFGVVDSLMPDIQEHARINNITVSEAIYNIFKDGLYKYTGV